MSDYKTKTRGFPIALIGTGGGQQLAHVVDRHLQELVRHHGEPCPETYVRRAENPRFQNGEGKAIIHDSIRGADLFIFVDIGNYGCTYKMHDMDVPMSPDEHYQDLKRLLGAAKNMPQRTTVIMPLLYAGRQHKMHGRESLDCAMALQELTSLGVSAVMTIDAHNSHVMNAIPMHGIENLHAAYQIIEAFLRETRGRFEINEETLLVASPDLGGMERARYFAEHFGVHLSGFYKFRDLTRVVDGKNPVLDHKFLGMDVWGRNVLVVDDMIASGGSMLEVCQALKKRGAGEIYLAVTYALFSKGPERFETAYREGLFRRVIATNATYMPPDIVGREWFVTADVTPFIAKFIHTFNHDGSITKLLDSTERISMLLGREVPGHQAD